MKNFLNRFKNFGLLELLVIFSAAYVVVMLLWTASTRSAVEEKANTVKSNHKQIVEFINDEINEYVIAQYSNLDNGLSSYVNMFNQFSDNYSEINDITLIGSLLYVATDNGLFYIDYEENFLIDPSILIKIILLLYI